MYVKKQGISQNQDFPGIVHLRLQLVPIILLLFAIEQFRYYQQMKKPLIDSTSSDVCSQVKHLLTF